MRLFWNLEIYYMNTFNIYSNTGEEKKNYLFYNLNKKPRVFRIIICIFIYLLSSSRSTTFSKRLSELRFKKIFMIKGTEMSNLPIGYGFPIMNFGGT